MIVCWMLSTYSLSKTLKFLDNFPEIEAYIVYTDKNGKFKTYISEKMVSRIINY